MQKMLITDEQLIGRVSAVVQRFDCEALALGPHALRQQDLGHIFGPSVIVRSRRSKISPEELAEMTVQVTTKVPGITQISLQS
jgi:hypothetical protein